MLSEKHLKGTKIKNYEHQWQVVYTNSEGKKGCYLNQMLFNPRHINYEVTFEYLMTYNQDWRGSYRKCEILT
jgi:hypothetical protein